MPRTIVSDRDTKFTSKFWQELTKILDIKLAMSTAFHPQTDGQTERANRTLETMLRAFVNQKQNNWDMLLPALEFAYNNSVNPSTGFSPFYLNTGFHPNVPASLLQPTISTAPSVEEFVEGQRATLILAQDALVDAQERQAHYADERRKDHDFKIGDQILLNAEDITLPANRTQKSKKLQSQFIGPYTIIEQHSPVSFRVELPPNMKIHNVFHVDRFRHYHPSPESLGNRSPPQPAPNIIDGEEEYEVEEILDHRRYRRQNQFLVLWKGYPRESSTWEPISQLTNCSDILQDYISKSGIKLNIKP
jgi:transposase InsO family protein